MAPGGAHSFIFIIDMSGSLEMLFKPVSSVKGAWPPEPQDVLNLRGNIDHPFRAHLLQDKFHREDMGKILRNEGFSCARVERRIQRCGKICQDIIPGLRHLVLIEKDFGVHGVSFVVYKYIHCCTTLFIDGWERGVYQ
jgi:hypothetical protein